MQVKPERPSVFGAEVKIIPIWAWALAGLGFAFAQVGFGLFISGRGAPPVWARSLLGLLAGTVLGGYLLLIGYVNRDSRRRGMSAILWTIVAIFIPNGLGIILYFILRQPLQRICPQCGSSVQTGFNFCPRCSHKLSSSCPHCQRLVGVNDVYCPYCGTTLREPKVPEYAMRSGEAKGV